MRYSHACTAIMALVLTLVLIGCGKDEPGIAEQHTVSTSAPAQQKSVTGGTGSVMLSTINATLEAQGKSCRMLMMEYITASASEKAGRVVFAKNVGNKQLTAHSGTLDPRRWGGAG